MFSVTLPRIDRNGGPAPTPAGPAARLDESVVVVVDGDLQVLEVVCRVLRDLGARALPARSAMEARRLLDECALAPALVICAQQIEAETGQAVVAALRGRHGAALPALLLAHAAPEQLRALESATGLPVLPKPVNPVELRRVLAQLRLPRPAGRASVAPG
jgi:CheY-like chemotaxis protein